MNEIFIHASVNRGKRQTMGHRKIYYDYFIVDVYRFTNYSGEELVVSYYDASQESYDEINYSWGSEL
jgi:hypothetical protein